MLVVPGVVFVSWLLLQAMWALGTDGLDSGVDLDLACLLEHERYRQQITFLQRRLQTKQHDVIAGRLEEGASARRNAELFEFAHLHDAVVHRVRVDLDAAGGRR